jgi:dTDP-4-dehydrorhamnose 3,5-epimerase
MSTPRLIVPRRFGDARGWFSESYSRRALAELGILDEFIQDNHSLSAFKGTLRGLHFQSPPHAQAKLVRCIAGAIWDIAVDVRTGSPTYGKWAGAKLTAAGGEQLYVPIGYAHGFVTLTENVEVAYKTSDYYAPEFDGGIIWNDPDISVAWPIADLDPILSDKDQKLQRLKDFVSPFQYDGIPLSPIV